MQARLARAHLSAADNVELIEMHNDHGEDGGALLVGHMPEDAGNCLLPLGKREECDEGMDRRLTNWLVNFKLAPEPCVQLLHRLRPPDIALHEVQVRVAGDRGRHFAVVILHLHQSIVNLLDISEDSFPVNAMSWRVDGPMSAARSVDVGSALASLDIEQGFGRLRVAERDLAQAPFDNQ